MTRLTTTNPSVVEVDPPEGATRAEHLELLIRQFLTARVTRCANLSRHVQDCEHCIGCGLEPDTTHYCYTGRHLASRVDDARARLQELADELEELARPEPPAEPARPVTLY